MVDTWALKGLPYHDFGVYVYAMKLHGAFGVDSEQLEHGCRMISAGALSFFGLELMDGPVPTSCLPL